MATGYGAGLWFAPLQKLSINASVAFSDEDFIPMIGFFWRL
jgi:hypothetical protein